MPIIELTREKVTQVDETDFFDLSKHKWLALWTGKKWYAARAEYIKESRKIRWILMHRSILVVNSDQMVDHINGDSLDNRRANLRLATGRQNSYNSKLRKDNSTGIKGLSYAKKGRKPWLAQIVNAQGKRISKGFAERSDAEQWLKDIRQAEHKEFTRHG
jgi:hypothetical protein